MPTWGKVLRIIGTAKIFESLPGTIGRKSTFTLHALQYFTRRYNTFCSHNMNVTTPKGKCSYEESIGTSHIYSTLSSPAFTRTENVGYLIERTFAPISTVSIRQGHRQRAIST